MVSGLYAVILAVIQLYMFILFAYVIASWLIAFNVINMRNPLAAQIVRALEALVEPVARPIRRFIPPVGGLDLSIIVIFLALIFLHATISDFAGLA